MLPRSRRLARTDFAVVGARGRRASTPHFTASYTDAVRGYAVVVSKKVARTSVMRHLLKRRTQRVLAGLADGPSAIVVYVRPGAASLSRDAYYAELEALMAQLPRESHKNG